VSDTAYLLFLPSRRPAGFQVQLWFLYSSFSETVSPGQNRCPFPEYVPFSLEHYSLSRVLPVPYGKRLSLFQELALSLQDQHGFQTSSMQPLSSTSARPFQMPPHRGSDGTASEICSFRGSYPPILP